MADSLVLVTGATGTVGTAVLADLKGKPGIKLRALVRSPDKAATLVEEGYEAVLGDLEEPDTLPQAFDGVDVLFLLTPASALEPSMGSNAVAAARQAGVKHIVSNSAIKAAHGRSKPKRPPARAGRGCGEGVRHSLDDPEAPLLHAEPAELGELCRV